MLTVKDATCSCVSSHIPLMMSWLASQVPLLSNLMTQRNSINTLTPHGLQKTNRHTMLRSKQTHVNPKDTKLRYYVAIAPQLQNTKLSFFSMGWISQIDHTSFSGVDIHKIIDSKVFGHDVFVVVTTFTWDHQLPSQPYPTPETKDELWWGELKKTPLDTDPSILTAKYTSNIRTYMIAAQHHGSCSRDMKNEY